MNMTPLGLLSAARSKSCKLCAELQWFRIRDNLGCSRVGSASYLPAAIWPRLWDELAVKHVGERSVSCKTTARSFSPKYEQFFLFLHFDSNGWKQLLRSHVPKSWHNPAISTHKMSSSVMFRSGCFACSARTNWPARYDTLKPQVSVFGAWMTLERGNVGSWLRRQNKTFHRPYPSECSNRLLQPPGKT